MQGFPPNQRIPICKTNLNVMGEFRLDYPVSRKGRLPAAVISQAFMEKFWRTLGDQGEFVWSATIGNDSERLGKKTERSQYVIKERAALERELASDTVDFFEFIAEYPEKGTLTLIYKNYDPAGGVLVVAGLSDEWAALVYGAIEQLFLTVKDAFATRLHHRYASIVTHSVIPLVLAFFIVIGAAGLIIPGDIRRSEYIWWIVTITVVANLKLGQIISDRLTVFLLFRYPYLRWQR